MVQLHQNSLIGVVLRSLIIRVEDEIAEGVENDLLPHPFVVHGNVGMMRHDNVHAHIQEFQISISRVAGGERCEFLPAWATRMHHRQCALISFTVLRICSVSFQR